MSMIKTRRLCIVISSLLILSACESSDAPNDTNTPANTQGSTQGSTQANTAAITAVTTSGEPGNYTFSVTIKSPDTGCEQYADWWEVFTADGTLVYRRILTHSHVDEQPFSRSGGPVGILADDTITVRAHMNNVGYGTQVFKGSISQGLDAESIHKHIWSFL